MSVINFIPQAGNSFQVVRGSMSDSVLLGVLHCGPGNPKFIPAVNSELHISDLGIIRNFAHSCSSKS